MMAKLFQVVGCEFGLVGVEKCDLSNGIFGAFWNRRSGDKVPRC